MKNIGVARIAVSAVLVIIVLVANAAILTPAVAEIVLFQDNFSYPYPGPSPWNGNIGYSGDINSFIDHPGRQSGSLVAAEGPITYSEADHGGETVIGYSGAVNASQNVLQGWIGANVTLNKNFNGALSAGGLKISYDAANWGPWGDVNDLALTTIGQDVPPTNTDPGNIAQTLTPHFTFEFGYGSYFGTSVYGMWDTGTAMAGGELPVSVYDYNLHHVDILCTDPTDQNPFDGVGQTDISVYVDGSLVNSCSKTGGGYANNYITLGGYEYGNSAQEWGNLTVTQIPEPSTLTLLIAVAIGLAWFRSRRQ